jgi:hypothetical protein
MKEFVQLIAWFQDVTANHGVYGLFAMTLLALILALSLSLMLVIKL